MNTSEPNVSNSKVATLLKEAKLGVRESLRTQGGELHEIDETHCGGRRGLVFDERENGVVVALRVELPEGNPLRAVPVTSTEALTLLGALTFALQAHGAEARLIGGEKGLEAVMISTRLCKGAEKASDLRENLDRLRQLATDIEPTLATASTPVTDLVDRLRLNVAALAERAWNDAVVVPTFDETARNRMMQELK